MASGSDLTLQILIKTVADAKGIAVTDEQVKKLTADLTAAAQAGKPLEVSADSIAKKLEEVRRTSASVTAAAEKTSQATSDVTEEMKDQARVAVKNIELSEQQAKSANNLHKEVGSLKLGFTGLSGVIKGTLSGDLTQIGQGFFNIGKAVTGAGTSTASLFAQIARGGAIGGLFAAPAVAGLILLEKQAAKTRAQITKIFTDRDKASAELKEAIAANDEAAKKSLDAQIKSVEKLTSRYQALIAAMDAAAAQSAKVAEAEARRDLAKIDRDEQLALGTAKTPEAAAKISANAADARRKINDRSAAYDLDNANLQANVRKKNAEDTLAAAQNEIDAADADARAKRTAADEAISVSRQALQRDGAGSGNYRRAATAAGVAAADAKAAEANRDAVRDRINPTIDAARKEIENANNIAQLVAIQREALIYAKQAAAKKDENAAVPRLKELAAKAESAGLAQDFTAQDQAVADLKALRAQLASRTAELKRTTPDLTSAITRNAAAHQERDEVIIKSINGQAVKAEQTARQLKNSRAD